MYSQAGIIVGAVMSALFGLYVFITDDGLRTSNYWLGVWQPMLLNASVVVTHSPLSKTKDESQFPLHPSNEKQEEEEEEVMDVNQFQFIGHEDIMKRLQAMSDLHDPDIGPGIPPPVSLSRMLQFHQAIVEILSLLWPHFIICLLLYLLGLVLAQKTCILRKLQKLYQAGKHKNVELLAGQKSKETLDKAKNRDKDKEKGTTASEQLEQPRTETLDDAKVNDDWVKEIMFEDPSELPDSKGLSKAKRRDDDEKRPEFFKKSEQLRTETPDDGKANDDRVREVMVEDQVELPDSKGLPKAKRCDEDEEKRPAASDQSKQPRTETLDDAKANDARVREIMVEEDPSALSASKDLPKAKHRRPGRRNSKRDHKFEAEKRKRKQVEKKAAALACVVEE